MQINKCKLYVPDFIQPPNWPPNSDVLNPVDNSVWGALQQLVHWQEITDIGHLKHVLTSEQLLTT